MWTVTSQGLADVDSDISGPAWLMWTVTSRGLTETHGALNTLSESSRQVPQKTRWGFTFHPITDED